MVVASRHPPVWQGCCCLYGPPHPQGTLAHLCLGVCAECATRLVRQHYAMLDGGCVFLARDHPLLASQACTSHMVSGSSYGAAVFARLQAHPLPMLSISWPWMMRRHCIRRVVRAVDSVCLPRTRRRPPTLQPLGIHFHRVFSLFATCFLPPFSSLRCPAMVLGVQCLPSAFRTTCHSPCCDAQSAFNFRVQLAI